MTNSEEFLKQAAYKMSSAGKEAVDRIVASTSGSKSLAEALVLGGVLGDKQLIELLDTFAKEEQLAGRKASFESVQFGETLVRRSHATILDVWVAIKAQEEARAGGKERSLDYFLQKEADLDPEMTLDVIQDTGRQILVCRDCGHREITTDADGSSEFTCPECSGVLVTAEEAESLGLDEEEVDPLVGQVIGECKLEKKLGQGGMGYVYKARHLALNKAVAIKFLADHIMNETAKKRFLKEARAAAKLEHGNIVTVYNTGTDKGKHFIIMQFIEGYSVGDRLKETGPLPVDEAVDVGIQAAQGIAAAHDLNMIHRDIKPDNLMVDKRGSVKVADFGLAKDLSDESGITISQQAMGTPHYMAPEQAEDAKTADKRSDIYSFGATLYASLAGSAPFAGTTPWAIISQHQSAPVPDVRERNPAVPESLWVVIQRMMEKRREDRYQAMDDVIRDLKGVQAGLPAGQLAASAPPAPRPQYVEMATPATISPEQASRASQPTFSDSATPATIAPPAAKGSKMGLFIGVGLVLAAGIVVGALFFAGVFDKGGGTSKKPGDGGTDKGGQDEPGGGKDKPGDNGGKASGGADKPGTPARPGKVDQATADAADEYSKILFPEVDGLAATGRYVEALDKLRKFPKKFKDTPAAEQVETKKVGVVTMAVANFTSRLEALSPAEVADDPAAVQSRLEGFEATLKTLAERWKPAAEVDGYADLTFALGKKVGELEAVSAEVGWLETTREKLASLSDKELGVARERVEADAKGKIPGAEKTARDVLAALKAEQEKRANKGIWAEYEKAVQVARRAADRGDFDKAVRMVDPYTKSELEGVRKAALATVETFEKQKAAGVSGKAEAAFQDVLQRAVKHADAFRFKEALDLLDPYTQSKVANIRYKALEKASEIRKLREKLGKFGKDKERADALVKSGRWSALGKARAIIEKLLASDAPGRVKVAARKKLQDIAAEKAKRLDAFEKRGLMAAAVEGEARLGSDAAEDNNKPHTVKLGTFLVSMHEVTNGEYARFVKATRKKGPRYWRRVRDFKRIARHPVTWVSAEDARAYCTWLSRQSKAKCRLPTPDEWEAAAGWDGKAKKMRRYPWGDAFVSDAAHLDGSKPAAVGSNEKDRSPFGVFDMAGNVCEWTYDPVAKRFVVCGGGFEDGGDEAAARCAFRQNLPPGTRGGSLGFRVVRELD